MNAGETLWQQAKKLIPGGGMLLSKRSEMLLPGEWPAYFRRAAGCRIWDLEGRMFTDTSLMGVGTNILGYAREEVNEAVIEAVRAGSISSLNCYEDVLLAERLVAMHPWSEMVRFARTGGEADAIAVRIARAASQKDDVALCGYHGWHDWYLAANTSTSDALDGHLLPGLRTNGVPKVLAGTVHPFEYGNLDQLQAIIDAHEVGTIIMEVARSGEPDVAFLEGARRIASKNGAVLIFDECTSGFRENFGGLHLKYGVFPDLAVFGKALGNGFPITAVIGRRDVMEAAQDSFISSTFWSERIGPVAALKTLEVMESLNSWDFITDVGKAIRMGWQRIERKYEIPMRYWGLNAIPGFTIVSPESLAFKTLITQEMLDRGFLASNSVYVSMAHTPDVIAQYLDALDTVFKTVKECEQGRPISELLRGPVCHDGFRRLN